jgi:hypothetical protein
MLPLPLALSVCAAAALGAAQSAFPVTISASCGGGGTRFRQSLETAATAPYAAPAGFGSTDPADCDHAMLYAHACFWRIASDARLGQFYDSGTALDQGGITHTVGSDTWTVRWPDVANRGLLDATWTQTIECRAPDSALVTNTWVLRNIAPTARTFELYAYTDFDLGADHRVNSTTPPATSGRQIVADAGACLGCAEFYGEAATSWEVDFYPNSEVRLTADPFAGLSDGALPLARDDYSGVLGWSRSLQPGQSWTVTYTHGRNALYCASPAAVQHYGSASSASIAIGTADTPSPGAAMRIDMQGPASAAAAVFFGVQQLNLPFPGCPITILVNPFLSLPITLDGTGRTTLALRGDCAPVLCGFTIYLQLWALDPAATCLPVMHSDGLALTYGHP